MRQTWGTEPGMLVNGEREIDRQEKGPGASESLSPGLAGPVLPSAQDVLPRHLLSGS